jgi:hypothetical protein
MALNRLAVLKTFALRRNYLLEVAALVSFVSSHSVITPAHLVTWHTPLED